MGVIVVIVGTAIILVMEVPGLLKNKHKKDMAAFFILLFIGTALSIAKTLHVPIPTPLDLIAVIYKPFSQLLFRLLE